MNSFKIAIVVGLLALGMPKAADASTGVLWGIAGASCVPYYDDIQNAYYSNANHTISSADNSGIAVKFSCAASFGSSQPGGTTWVLRLHSSSDGDGASTAYYTKATLAKVNKSTGASSNVCIATSSSAAYAMTSCTAGVLDPTTYYYHVILEIRDSGAAGNPTITGADLWSDVI